MNKQDQDFEKPEVLTPVLRSGVWMKRNSIDQQLLAKLAVLTVRAIARYGYDAAITDEELLNQLHWVLTESKDLPSFEFFNEHNQSVDLSDNFAVRRLLHSNMPQLRQLYSLQNKQDIGQALFSYLYHQVDMRKDPELLLPLHLYDDVLSSWLQVKQNGNYIFRGISAYPVMQKMQGNLFIRGMFSSETIQIFQELSPDHTAWQFSDPMNFFEFQHNDFQYFDGALIIPELGSRIKDLSAADPVNLKGYASNLSETFLLESASKYVKGRAVVFLLGNRLNSNLKNQVALRAELCRNHMVKAVCQFPAGFMKHSFAQLAMIFLDTADTTSNEAVTFIDFSSVKLTRLRDTAAQHRQMASLLSEALNGQTNDYTVSVDFSEIEKNQFQLLPSMYASHEKRRLSRALAEFKTVPLGKVAEIVRCQITEEASNGGIKAGEVQLSSLDRFGFIDESAVSKEICCSADSSAFERQTLKNGDLVLAVKAVGVGAVGIAWDLHRPLIASQYFVILRLKEHAPLSVYDLFYALRSDLVRDYIALNTQGSVMPLLSADAISKLPVILPENLPQTDTESKFRHLASARSQLKEIESTCLQESVLTIMK